MINRSSVAAIFGKVIMLQYLCISVHIHLIFASRYWKTASMYIGCS